MQNNCACCPDEKCKEAIDRKLDEVKCALWGKDGLTGLVGCSHQKVSRTTAVAFMVGILVIVVIPAFLLVNNIWRIQQQDPITYIDTFEHTKLVERVISLETKLDTLVSTILKMDIQQDSMLQEIKKLRIQPGELPLK